MGTYLQNQTRGNPFTSRPGNMQELAANLQPIQHLASSGRQTLPPLCAATGQHAAATNSGAAGAKTVASLADQDARLKGAFHNETPKSKNGENGHRCIEFRPRGVNAMRWAMRRAMSQFVVPSDPMSDHALLTST